MGCLARRWQLSVKREHGAQEERKAEDSLRTRRQNPRNRRERGLPEEREEGEVGVVGTDKTKKD